MKSCLRLLRASFPSGTSSALAGERFESGPPTLIDKLDRLREVFVDPLFIHIARGIVGIAAVLATTASFAAFPDRGVTIVVPFPPGGPSDQISRTIAKNLAERWQQPVTIDNRPGGNTIIGAQAVARARPDGHTLLFSLDSTFSMNQSLYKQLPYDPEKDFAPITRIAIGPMVFAVDGKSPYATLADFLAAAKQQPGKLTVGGGSFIAQLCNELFSSMAGISVTYIPYKGSADTTQGLLSGAVTATFDGIGVSLPHITSGRLKALAVTSNQRFRSLPGLPTVAETVPNFDVPVWI